MSNFDEEEAQQRIMPKRHDEYPQGRKNAGAAAAPHESKPKDNDKV
eukprot:CAMPEP_0183584702 /NCGR_PEP_ID=MMETSP0371-20130417/153941_1 /TAXON_ID=268820 /ORGANISM="Peridinium aciculiferum, Strain PAER-2" /LENGTH=45 /DNA_ID= /DNA_START= /DNA_END= /DNA_ORIENTATION=